MTEYKLKAFDRFTNNEPAGDHATDFCADYDGSESAYFCDAFTEFSDSNTSIYYSDIEEFMTNNTEAVNEAIDEFGWDGCGRDIYKAAQLAEFMNIERELYRDFEEIKKTIAANLIERDEDGDDGETAQAWRKLTDERQKNLLDDFEIAVDGIGENDRLDSIADAFAEFQEAIKAAAE